MWYLKLEFSFLKFFDIVRNAWVMHDIFGDIYHTTVTKTYKIYEFVITFVYIIEAQNKNLLFPPDRTDRVRDDGVDVLGAGGRGDHDSSTSASRAARQLDFLGRQRRYGRLR